MRIMPAIQPGCAVWDFDNSYMTALGVWTEKKPDRGEDAEPLILHHHRSGLGTLAVCDGVGGAGVQMAGATPDGVERSGAWVSSRAVRLAVEQYFIQDMRAKAAPASIDPTIAAHSGQRAINNNSPSLRESIDGFLRELRNPARSRIGGTMQRELPSTLAAISYRLESPYLQLQVRWAGDSRCYLLAGHAGLQQLSRDDTEMPDALSSLEQDPPMTNQIAADGRYEIRDVLMQVEMPAILLCATDGFFNYVQTPAHFEYFLLDSLSKSASPAEWAESLAHRVRGYTQDDASLSLAAFGYPGFAELREAFHHRLEILHNEHWLPFRSSEYATDDEYRAVRLDSWQRYRTNYEQLIAQESGAGR